MSRPASFLVICVLAGCTDVPQPYELDHTRVVAVRVEPPALAPGGRARIDVLVTDDVGGPRMASTFTATAPSGIRLDGAEIVAPSAEELASARAALGLAPDADVIVPIEIVVNMTDGPLVAQKTIAFGRDAANPAAPALLVDGTPTADQVVATAASELSVADEDPALSYRWFSSVGDLIGYTTSRARFDDPSAGEGTVGVVVRDQSGGVAWTFVPATVQP